MVLFPGECILFFSFGINESPIIDFHFPLLAPISKRGRETAAAAAAAAAAANDDDDDDEWIMFQLCADAKR